MTLSCTTVESLAGLSDRRLQDLIDAATGRPCAQPLADPEQWFPLVERADQAARLCQPCPVRGLCLERALRRPEAGIWGGRTTGDRARMIRRGGRAPGPARG